MELQGSTVHFKLCESGAFGKKGHVWALYNTPPGVTPTSRLWLGCNAGTAGDNLDFAACFVCENWGRGAPVTKTWPLSRP